MKTDVLVLGAGVAGLAAALAVEGRRVFVAGETPLGRDLASAWAQGGVAAALGAADSPLLHAADTLAAGGGIAEPDVAETLAREAPAAIDALVRLGVPFARADDGALALGLEAAHSRRRIVHVADATGAAILDALLAQARRRPNVQLCDGLRASALLVRPGRVVGAVLVTPAGDQVRVEANAVVLATGGFGGLYARTTTPLAARGAGIALAARAGATLADLEFVQFHPTALRTTADPLPLVSEAVRGEGALLVDAHGTRIMDGIDARGELAPRDVVARAVAAVEAAGGSVLLDAREALGERFAARFPGIFATARRAGIDPRTQPLPVKAVAHYTIGGVATDAYGRTNVPGLWACGEVAATGLHGANRLASNSLVEGLVFGARVGEDVSAIGGTQSASGARSAGARESVAHGTVGAALRELRATMSDALGVVRDEPAMLRALDAFTALERTATDDRIADAALVGTLVARAALARRESRGAHQRSDYAASDPRCAQRSFVAPARLARIS
ncbi:MAG TPA: L-aspartate oxidase [Candidatus Sulfotelmatobacter sp.]|nr:L-aspartate oxidase [Candidatus Sulfotelmatobacter sp.]